MTKRGRFSISRDLVMEEAADGSWELVARLSNENQSDLATVIASAIVDNPSLTAAAIASALVSNPALAPSASDEGTIFASAVRAATQVATDTLNTAFSKGVMLILNVTAVAALQTLELQIQAKDSTSGSYITIATTGAIGVTATATGTYALIMRAGIGSLVSSLTAVTGVGLPLPYTWRARIAHSGAGNFTYSLGRVYLR